MILWFRSGKTAKESVYQQQVTLCQQTLVSDKKTLSKIQDQTAISDLYILTFRPQLIDPKNTTCLRHLFRIRPMEDVHRRPALVCTGAMKRTEHSSVATICAPPPRKQLVWAPGHGVTATTSSWWAPGGPLQPRGPHRDRGACGALATPLTEHVKLLSDFNQGYC